MDEGGLWVVGAGAGRLVVAGGGFQEGGGRDGNYERLWYRYQGRRGVSNGEFAGRGFVW